MSERLVRASDVRKILRELRDEYPTNETEWEKGWMQGVAAAIKHIRRVPTAKEPTHD